MKQILVTGGLGFIGSHTAIELVRSGFRPIIVDNLVNTRQSVHKTLEEITNTTIDFYEIDVRNTQKLIEIMAKHQVSSVIHFAALKAVGESVEKPLLYYQNNIGSLLSLLEAMQNTDTSSLVFSSSATVYGDPDTLPITEDAQLKPSTNPYGTSKQMAEQIISDAAGASTLKAALLRYFNPIGAHESGTLGELPLGPPNNLVPYVTQAAAGVRKELTVFGDDYPTPDGTGIRDYIHVVDLAKAHVKAINHLEKTEQPTTTLNLGTGQGHSVLELIKTFEEVNGVKVPYVVGKRRPGDIASCYASAKKAEQVLGWKTEKSLQDALKDAWRWQQHVTKYKIK